MSFPQFIAVQKITTNGRGQIKKMAETIRLDLVRSARPWKKTPEEKLAIQEDVTVLYMMPDKDESQEGKQAKDTKVKIAESKEDFDARVGAIQERMKEAGVKIERASENG